ncbi:MAG: DJ-1/PfpI family protein [Bacteroidota bacterium]
MLRFLPVTLALVLAACATDSPSSADDGEAALVLPDSIPEITAENHDAVMVDLFGEATHGLNTIGILVYDGVNDLDALGPRYVLGQLMGVDLQLIALEPGTITTVMGTELVPNTTIAEVDSLDLLVIPGGFTGTIDATYDTTLHDWIRRIDQTTTYTAAVCTGVWVLGATGLLEGRRATTNWYRAEEMLARYGATFTDERYTNDGKYWTAAGVTAGMDMSLALMNEVAGEAYAQAVMLDMEYDPAPPIAGGSPEKTAPGVLSMMQAMYDMGVQPRLDSLDARAAGGDTDA